MRVLHVIPSVAARYGGPSTAIAPMCRALAARGIDSMIATTDADGSGSLEVSRDRPTTWQGIPAIFFKRDFSEAFKYSLGLARWVTGHVTDFDVVHIHGVLSHACLATAAACRRQQIPYVVRPLGTLAPWSLHQKAIRKRLILLFGATRMLQSAAAIHCTSEEEKRGIHQVIDDGRAVVIPLGIDPEFLEVPPVARSDSEHEPYVLVVSRLHQKKNLTALIDAFLQASAKPEGARWRLLIAGDGKAAYTRTLEQLVHLRMARDRVIFLGWVDGDRKHELIRHAAIFALVSFQENFGISLLEALACGVPALVSRQVDLADAVERAGAGWIVDTSADSLRRGLEMALVDQRASKSAAARTLAQRFAWSSVSSQLVDLYASITERRRIKTTATELSDAALLKARHQ